MEMRFKLVLIPIILVFNSILIRVHFIHCRFHFNGFQVNIHWVFLGFKRFKFSIDFNQFLSISHGSNFKGVSGAALSNAFNKRPPPPHMEYLFGAPGRTSCKIMGGEATNV